MYAADPLPGLFHVIDSQHAENHGYLHVQVQLTHTAGYGLAHIFEMRCSATHHATKRYERGWCVVVGPALLDGKWNFDRPGNDDCAVVDLVLLKNPLAAVLELVNNLAVPLCFHQNNKGILGFLDA